MNGKRFERDKVIPGIHGDDVICDIFDAGHRAAQVRRPAIVFVHGGGFVGGDKDQFFGAASWLALTMDILCVTIQYRLAPEFTCPAPIQDCLSVFSWLWENQEELRIDPRLVFAAGGSPGANIAAMAMFADDPECPFQPDNGIFLNGIYDLNGFYDQNPAERRRVLQYLGCESYDEALGKRYSPMFQKPDGKHILMLHGSEDQIVPLTQCEAMKHTLESCGSRAWIRVFQGKGHAWFNQEQEWYGVLETIRDFIIMREDEVKNDGT